MPINKFFQIAIIYSVMSFVFYVGGGMLRPSYQKFMNHKLYETRHGFSKWISFWFQSLSSSGRRWDVNNATFRGCWLFPLTLELYDIYHYIENMPNMCCRRNNKFLANFEIWLKELILVVRAYQQSSKFGMTTKLEI